jgi:peptide-N4-(N-acetyl-beta-glucosaminyl)asparagine amidase
MSATKTRDEVDAIAISLTIQLQFKLQNLPRSATTAGNRQSTADDARDLAKRFGQASTVRIPLSDRRNHWILDTFDHLDQEIDRYEDPTLHERALDVIPFDKLASQAEDLAGARLDLDFQDCLAQVLVEWAKRDFLKWVDPVKCAQCGGDTVAMGSGTSSIEEKERGGAGRVELYKCKKDGSITRFPRYTKLEKLLQTKTGRCGEFAALFMLLLRSLGFRARYIWNSEDHVWNEYYSEHLKRWVHLDSCEGARDKHLLYDLGWGKKMKVCPLISVVQKSAEYVIVLYSFRPGWCSRRNTILCLELGGCTWSPPD